jgi:hypothetical protein
LEARLLRAAEEKNKTIAYAPVTVGMQFIPVVKVDPLAELPGTVRR